jgi:hypothetical protein
MANKAKKKSKKQEWVSVAGEYLSRLMAVRDCAADVLYGEGKLTKRLGKLDKAVKKSDKADSTKTKAAIQPDPPPLAH